MKLTSPAALAALSLALVATLSGCVPTDESPHSTAAKQVLADLAALEEDAREAAALRLIAASEAEAWRASGIEEAGGGEAATREQLGWRATGGAGDVKFTGEGSYTVISSSDDVATKLDLDGTVATIAPDGSRFPASADLEFSLTPIDAC